MKPLAVCIGDNCVDYYLPPVDRRFVGGNAVNVAVYLQQNGVSTAYVGVVGDDSDGVLIRNRIRQQGVDVSNVQVLPGKTARTDVRLSSQGDREFVSEHLGPPNPYHLSEASIEFIFQHSLVHNTWLGGYEAYLPEFRQAEGLVVSLDYGERYTLDFVQRTIKNVDLAFFSLPESNAPNVQELARQMFEQGPQLVVVTMGIQGSLAYDGRAHFQPAIPTEVVDTLGAGDAYIGTFLANWLRGKEIPQCMERATQAAAQTCTHYGAWLQSEQQGS